ncbi:DUF2155 domain-containing protein [bacterium]|nr:DUF2155 domain-containing protein [bacterium]
MIRAWLVVAALAQASLATAADVVEAKGGVVRVLDRLTDIVTDYDLAPGQVQTEGRLSVRLDECRYPSDQPLGEAYAHLTISDAQQVEPIFKGWMIASSPGLNALDHPRYDVWVLHCDVPASALPPTDQTDGSGAGSTSSGAGSGG